MLEYILLLWSTSEPFYFLCRFEHCKYAQNLSMKVLFMLVKSGAMVASKQTIYGKKANIIIGIATPL